MNTLFFGWWWVGGGLDKFNSTQTSLDWTLLNLFSSLYHCGLDPPSLLFSLLWCDCSAFIQNSRSSTLNFFPATQTVGREGEGWGNDGHCGLLLFTPCHSVLSYPDRQTLVGVGGISSSFLALLHCDV